MNFEQMLKLECTAFCTYHCSILYYNADGRKFQPSWLVFFYSFAEEEKMTSYTLNAICLPHNVTVNSVTEENVTSDCPKQGHNLTSALKIKASDK